MVQSGIGERWYLSGGKLAHLGCWPNAPLMGARAAFNQCNLKCHIQKESRWPNLESARDGICPVECSRIWVVDRMHLSWEVAQPSNNAI